MELLLNLVWLALALLSFFAFVRKRKLSSVRSQCPYGTALLALACALVLLFPVVSASDDLHPTQAVLEDATKRVQQLAASLHSGNLVSFSAMVFALLATYLLAALIALHVWRFDLPETHVIRLARKPIAGRSPPPL
jgi:NADH:ubiquinone oxidoreductase subunit 6 (subunit J)